MRLLKLHYLLFISIIVIINSCGGNSIVITDIQQIDSLLLTKEITKVEVDMLNGQIIKLNLTGHYPQKKMIKSQSHIIKLDSLRELGLYYMDLDILKIPKNVKTLHIEKCKLSDNALLSIKGKSLQQLNIVHKNRKETIKLSNIPDDITNLYIQGTNVDFQLKDKAITFKKVVLIESEFIISKIANVKIDTLVIYLNRNQNIDSLTIKKQLPNTCFYFNPRHETK